MVIYQECFGGVTWHHNLKRVPLKTWTEVEAFRKSIPYCKVILDDVFFLLERFAANFPDDRAIHALVHASCEKMKVDAELREQASARFGEIIFNARLRRFAARFLLAVVNGNEEVYLQKFDGLRNLIDNENGAEVLDALCIAAPNEALYKHKCIPLLHEHLASQMLSRADYLNLASKKPVSIPAMQEFAVHVSQSLQSTEEGHAVIAYLDSFVEHSESVWFAQAAKSILTYPDQELVSHLNNFLHELAERNLSLFYKLMRARFETLGDSCWLESAAIYLAADRNHFSRHLTRWFLSENPKVHLAMRELCSRHRPISDDHFVLSADGLSRLSSSEKLFIAVKIGGYVYSKEALQNLIVSLTNSCKESEAVLLENLYLMFDQYVIYNYRGTLEKLGSEVRKEELPAHLRRFYTRLIDSYEEYFKQLSNIPDMMELRADYAISRYRDFYEQAVWQRLHAQSEKSSFLSIMAKSVSIKSPAWAIRRPGQDVHNVQPLGHFETSAEFPMGERLNPIFQEKTRRHYRRLTKHEVDID